MAILVAALAVPAAFANKGGIPNHGYGQGKGKGNVYDTDHYSAAVAVDWFNLIYNAVRTERLSPVVAARVYGLAGVTLYEAVVPGMHDHLSLAGQLNELGPLPSSDGHKKYQWPAVANAALARLTRGLFANASAPTLDAIDALERQENAVNRSLSPPPFMAHSVEHGRDVADAILAWASTDGFRENNNCPYTPPTGPGLWIPTPPGFRPALQPCWGQLRPMVLVAGDECAAALPVPFSEDRSSEFFAQANEVYNTVNGLTPEQTAIARFWSDDAAATGTPPGHWVSIVSQLATSGDWSLDVAAESFARVGIAVNDAFIACWNTKFIYNVIRPVSYIQAHIDANWLPLLVTPPFPEYTSGHSTQSSAASAVLTDQLGTVAFTDNTPAFLGLPARSFSSFEAAADEAAISRLYGGIHYRAAIENGLAQGQCVGERIIDRVHFSAH